MHFVDFLVRNIVKKAMVLVFAALLLGIYSNAIGIIYSGAND